MLSHACSGTEKLIRNEELRKPASVFQPVSLDIGSMAGTFMCIYFEKVLAGNIRIAELMGETCPIPLTNGLKKRERECLPYRFCRYYRSSQL